MGLKPLTPGDREKNVFNEFSHGFRYFCRVGGDVEKSLTKFQTSKKFICKVLSFYRNDGHSYDNEKWRSSNRGRAKRGWKQRISSSVLTGRKNICKHEF